MATSPSELDGSTAPSTPVIFNGADSKGKRAGGGGGSAPTRSAGLTGIDGTPDRKPAKTKKNRLPKSASNLRLSQSRLRLDSASPFRSNHSTSQLHEYFHSSSGALASAGRERDAGRDQHGNRWHAHAFPARVESLRDITALVDLVDDRSVGKFEGSDLTEERVQEHVKNAPRKIRGALQEYYDSQLEILEGWREADEILESAFPSEVLRRYGTEADVDRFLAKSRYSQMHLNRLQTADSDASDTGYDEDEEADEDDEDINARRGSIARAASALSGFWFNAKTTPRRKRENSTGLSSDDLEEGAALLGRDRDGTPSRGRRGFSTRNAVNTPYGSLAFSSQIPSTTPIAEHNEGSRQLELPASGSAARQGASRSQTRDVSPLSGSRPAGAAAGDATPSEGDGEVSPVSKGAVDPHVRRDSLSGRVVSVESEASAKGGNGRASEDGSLDRKLARARELKERELNTREEAVKGSTLTEKGGGGGGQSFARSGSGAGSGSAGSRDQGHGTQRKSIIVDSTDDDDGGVSDAIVLDRAGPSAEAMSGYQPLTHSGGSGSATAKSTGASSNTIKGSTNHGEPDPALKGELVGEETSTIPAVTQQGNANKPITTRPTTASSSTSNGNGAATANGNNGTGSDTNNNNKPNWGSRTAVDTLQERERRLLLEIVPGKMEKTAELEKNTQFAININLAINILLIAGKGFAVITSNSVSLIASFVDSVLDLLSTVIIFITSKAIAYRSAHTIWKYPLGKKRFESLGVVIFSVLMLTSFSQVLVESVQRLMKVMRTGEEQGENPAELPVIGIVFMLITIVVKTAMWLLYRNSPSSGVRALAQDAQNDVVFNIASLLFPAVGSLLKAPALDPIGGIVLSLYIIKEWLETLASTVTRLSGAVAGKEHLARALYLVTRFRSVKAVSAFELYYSGDEVIAEADVVLPLNTPLKEAHDVCEVITYCLEVIDIERAYVHLDYHIHNPAGHLTQRG